MKSLLEVSPDEAGQLGPTPRALVWLRLALATALLGPALLLAYEGWRSYDETIDAAKGRIARRAQIAQQQSLRILETNELISRGIATRVGSRSNDELRGSGGELHAVLKAWTHGLTQLQSVWIWDNVGRPVATNLRPDPPSTLDVSDREYFRWAREQNSSGWYVSPPLRSRLTGELFFDFVKRRTGSDGSFEGAISVSLRPAYFDEFFRSQVSGDRGVTLSLFRADGTIISRYPAPAAQASKLASSSPLLGAMSANRDSGMVEGTSSIDGEYRYVAFQRIGDLPLYAVSTASRSALLEPWRKSMVLLASFTLPLALGLAALCWFAIRRVRREHAIAVAHKEQYEQRLKAEEALRHAQKMEALGRLTGGVAHDFNNLLMVIQSSATLARRLEAAGKHIGRALDPIDRAVSNGAQLTRQLLAVVRRQPLEVRTVELGDILPGLTQLMASTLGSAVRITTDIQPGLQVTVDQAELELALINLFINARDAMPGGGAINLFAGESVPPADVVPSTPWIRITVSDAGEGIPSDILHRVTEPFFTTKPLGKGTGLGLSQVQSFVLQAGGRLDLQSEPGHGTRVSMLLPRVVATTAPLVPSLSTHKDLRALNATVLLVEDNPDIGEAVKAILHSAGATVTWLTTADEAWRVLSSGTAFDVILSDVTLPGGMSGIDLAHSLSVNALKIPVVLMTGYTDRLQEANAAGFRVLPKPAMPDRLIAALRESIQALSRP